MEMVTGGAGGCKAIALVTTRDLLPSRLPVCLNADLCHPLPTRDCFLTKQKQERMHKDTDDTHTCTRAHAQKYIHTTTCTWKKRGNKGQALPSSVFIKEKSEQNQLPITPCKAINIFSREEKGK